MVTLQACTAYGMETCLFDVHGDTQNSTYVLYVVIHVYYDVYIN